ncbi:hypothetical protein BRC83_06900 [Halobacteriales archaeon QS_1_68_17]|nr:MAG: hypothetical protein BRC83_06900 [Halobacteriales archaeon QS_1_68_17]
MTDVESPVVLVVDDNEAIANTYTAFLSEKFAVRTAYSGPEALDLLDESVEVVLLDRRMPELSGDAVLETIEERDLNCRIVMLTAVDPDFDIVEMGIDAYLVKPIERGELNDLVDEMLERSAYDDEFREFLALASKKAAIEAEMGSEALAESDEYERINRRLAERREEIGGDLADLESEFVHVETDFQSAADGDTDEE